MTRLVAGEGCDLTRSDAELAAGGRGGIALGFGLFALLLVMGAIVTWRLIAEERARDLMALQSRMSLIADARAGAVSGWLSRQLGEMSSLAENPSVQLYLAELSAVQGDGARITDGAAQLGYLRNLLLVTAARTGFSAPTPMPAVGANLRRVGTAGIAILDGARRPFVATPDMPPVEGRLAERIAAAAEGGGARVIDIFDGPDGAPEVGFLAPILTVEGGGAASRRNGWVLGVKPIAGELLPLLAPSAPGEPGNAATLVRAEGAALDILLPPGAARPEERRLARDTPGLAAAFALAEPGGFAEKRDFRGASVFVTGRALPPSPWVLAYEVDRAVALADTDRRAVRFAAFAALLLAALAGGCVALWKHASSRRAAAAARALAELAGRFESQGALLRLVTDSQPNAIIIADAEGRYRFANREAGRRAGLAEPDLLGKTLDAVLGPAVAARYLAGNRTALERGEPATRTDRIAGEGGAQVLRTVHVPLPADPGGSQSRVLVVEEDMTQLVREREQRERVMKQLVAALIAAIDRRDRYAADQSARVARIARAIAEEMGLDPVLAEAAETAGSLMNFGKILVPPELLTRAGRLTADEIRLVRSAVQATAEFIGGIEFDGPVGETLRQMQERVDGSGPLGLAGEAIVVTARIVAAANAFVALASPRAWRSGSDIDAALDALLARVGSEFDRRVVAALINWLDSRGGRARWAEPATASGSAA